MRKYILSLGFCLLSLAAMAQPKSLQVDINEIFAHYQNAFNNLTHSYNLLVKGYKKSSRPSDVHYYFKSAKKHTISTKTYLERAVASGEQMTSNARGIGCKTGFTKITQMNQNFSATDLKMDAALESLENGLATHDIQEMGTHLQAAVQSMQSGVQKLNLAIEELNGATAELQRCKK